MPDRGPAHLYLDNQLVGEVIPQRKDDAWSHGHFRPNESFAKFAPLFGRWSLLMHADGEFGHLTHAARDELRQTEIEMDSLRVKLHFYQRDEWVRVGQLNIDGPMVEWKAF